MPTISTLGHRLASPLFLLALVGCTDSTKVVDTLPRKAVNGSVTLDGQPLAQGQIQFDPVQGTQGPTAIAVADIKDGKYSIDRALGPLPGKYKVSISSRPSVTIGVDDMPGSKPKLEPEKVPAQYNSKSTLTKEITGDLVNTLDFDLKSR
jgi:hypothetical protein